jgi:hypothetical protein
VQDLRPLIRPHITKLYLHLKEIGPIALLKVDGLHLKLCEDLFFNSFLVLPSLYTFRVLAQYQDKLLSLLIGKVDILLRVEEKLF